MADEMKMIQQLNLNQPNFCDYSDTYILATEDIKLVDVAVNTCIVFKNAPFTSCVTHINDEHVESAKNLDIIMPMYNLLEYSESLYFWKSISA